MKNKTSDSLESALRREAAEFGISSVLVALSGGADSVALANAVKNSGLRAMALHCNFHLRGEESDRDMKFVETFCKSIGIHLIIKEFDTLAYLASNKGESLEMACRKLRYEWFEENLDEYEFDVVATGHNADDNIETSLLNMLRGSGTRGLKGMLPLSNRIWRPFLSVSRHQILKYIEENNLPYITDSSNLSSDFRRNFLRNEIIPMLRKEWKGFDSAMNRTIRNVSAENKVVEYYLENILKDYPYSLPVSVILEFPAPLLLIKRFIDPLSPYVTTPDEVLSAIKAAKPHIRKWELPGGSLILHNNNLKISYRN